MHDSLLEALLHSGDSGEKGYETDSCHIIIITLIQLK